MTSGERGTFVLTKHEAAGNDFLVLLEAPGLVPPDATEVRALCERRRGVGADGLILLSAGAGAADLAMELWNADGGPAETSGNGLRCAAQAAVGAGLVRPPRFRVATGAGVATVDFEVSEIPGSARATVDMGPVRLLGAAVTDPAGRPAQRADVGNPHLVVRCEDPNQIDLADMAARLAADFSGGINVEYVAPGRRRDELVMRVWERGAGATLACGSGSCAAAAVARAWGLVGDLVSVRNPGGTLEVSLGRKSGDPVLLGGPVRRVAEVFVERNVLR